MSQVLIGLVGYYQFVRGYPIGPELSERLHAHAWPNDVVSFKEMNWGPIAIVQDFQASDETYERIVLVTAVDRGLKTGTVTCRQWLGGKLDVLSVQDRVFEAVTGIINVDNLLVIGEHFGIWPKELISVEVQLGDHTFGDLVLSEIETNRANGEVNIVGDNPLMPEMEEIVARIFEATCIAATQPLDTIPGLQSMNAEQVTPLTDVCHNQFIEDCKLTSKIN